MLICLCTSLSSYILFCSVLHAFFKILIAVLKETLTCPELCKMFWQSVSYILKTIFCNCCLSYFVVYHTFVVYYLLFITYCLLVVIDWLSFVVYYLLFIICCLLFIGCHWLVIICCLSFVHFVVYCLLFIVYRTRKWKVGWQFFWSPQILSKCAKICFPKWEQIVTALQWLTK